MEHKRLLLIDSSIFRGQSSVQHSSFSPVWNSIHRLTVLFPCATSFSRCISPHFLKQRKHLLTKFAVCFIGIFSHTIKPSIQTFPLLTVHLISLHGLAGRRGSRGEFPCWDHWFFCFREEQVIPIHSLIYAGYATSMHLLYKGL